MITSDVKFLYHTSCNRCGSSDAKGIYSDGSSYCFSCRTYLKGNMSGYVITAKQQSEGEKLITPPDDINFEYSQECLQWLHQYDLVASDLIRHRVFWSNKYNQLLFIFQATDKPGVGLIQGRNFSEGKSKYFNVGDVNRVLPVFQFQEKERSDTLVLVEDVVSAIKIASNVWVDAAPILGSSIHTDKIVKLCNLGYKTVIVWLDHDKYREAMAISQKFKYAGPDSWIVTSDLDPKCYGLDILAKKLELTC